MIERMACAASDISGAAAWPQSISARACAGQMEASSTASTLAARHAAALLFINDGIVGADLVVYRIGGSRRYQAWHVCPPGNGNLDGDTYNLRAIPDEQALIPEGNRR
ncbi:hypothetical protein GCM10022270_12010 [Terriglobus aquaticus]